MVQRTRVIVLNGEIKLITPEGQQIVLSARRAVEIFFGCETREMVRHALREIEPKVERE